MTWIIVKRQFNSIGKKFSNYSSVSVKKFLFSWLLSYDVDLSGKWLIIFWITLVGDSCCTIFGSFCSFSVFFKHNFEAYLLFIYLADEEMTELVLLIKFYYVLILIEAPEYSCCIIDILSFKQMNCATFEDSFWMWLNHPIILINFPNWFVVDPDKSMIIILLMIS